MVKRAINMNESSWLSDLVEFEQSIHYSTPIPFGESPFVHLTGTRPILISAPHSAIHMRNGRLKRAEGFTGALAILLSQITGAHALYINYRLPADPNWDQHTPYKTTLKRIIDAYQIQFVIDLHGMSNRHKIGIALGTINGRSCPNEISLIENTLQNHHFRKITQQEAKAHTKLDWHTFVKNHSRFTGGLSNHTITRYVTDTVGIPCIQIELCSTIRVVFEDIPNGSPKTFRGNPKATRQMIRTFIDLIELL
ncbi:MAG: hypothetical protein AAF490_19060 [Chloroflexota bacterium]